MFAFDVSFSSLFISLLVVVILFQLLLLRCKLAVSEMV